MKSSARIKSDYEDFEDSMEITSFISFTGLGLAIWGLFTLELSTIVLGFGLFFVGFFIDLVAGKRETKTRKTKEDQEERDDLNAIRLPPEHLGTSLKRSSEATRVVIHKLETEESTSLIDKAITIEEQRCINCDCLFPGSDSGWWECHVESTPILITDEIARSCKFEDCTRWTS